MYTSLLCCLCFELCYLRTERFLRPPPPPPPARARLLSLVLNMNLLGKSNKSNQISIKENRKNEQKLLHKSMIGTFFREVMTSITPSSQIFVRLV